MQYERFMTQMNGDGREQEYSICVSQIYAVVPDLIRGLCPLTHIIRN